MGSPEPGRPTFDNILDRLRRGPLSTRELTLSFPGVTAANIVRTLGKLRTRGLVELDGDNRWLTHDPEPSDKLVAFKTLRCHFRGIRRDDVALFLAREEENYRHWLQLGAR